tara:strand:+ start:248 stop:1399 length:1152 start_codon:yes stop_codon:yes gene_type:complete
MKKLIFRNIFKDITYFFLLSSLTLTLIVWVIQSVNFLDFVTEDGHGLGIYATYSILNLPKIFSRLIIFIFFISTFYILYKYEDNNEMSILWIHGVKKIEFISNFIKFSFLFVLVQLLLTYIIVPTTQEKARTLFKNSDIDYLPSILKSKFFNDTIKNVTIFVGEKDIDGNLKHIFLKDNKSYIDGRNSSLQKPSQITISKSGKLVKRNRNYFLILNNGNIINLDSKKTNIIQFNRSEFNLSKYTSRTTTYPKIQETSSKLLLKCINFLILKNSSNFEKIFNCDEQNIDGVIKELYKRLGVPLYIFLIGLISSCLVLKSKNNNNFNFFQLFIFIFGFSVIVLSEISVQFINMDFLNNLLITLLPILFGIFFYILLIINSGFNKL